MREALINRSVIALCTGLVCFFRVFALGFAQEQSVASGVDFNRDIRPIFAEKCFSCHGPDQAGRQASLRLDTLKGLFATPVEEGPVIIPGNSQRSRLFLRISSKDDKLRMPPSYLGQEPLTEVQIKQIQTWINQGARWQQHWSLLPVRRPNIPNVRKPGWIRSPLDAFVLNRLDEEGLEPSPEAELETLIRRVTLDLTGLPPSPQEVGEFVKDGSPDAYEKMVDRLLLSSRYGEHMAARWLETARYADTNGYQSDGLRQMWRWRDWVIDAFNRNLSFDQFTLEQLAGDLLPGATRDQIIATGFNRNHRTSAEGGIIDEEFRIEYVADRVDTTTKVWMGMTLGCARCHDHKYDPISQDEYYQFFAFFNNVPERGFVYNFGNEDPIIAAPTPLQEVRLRELDGRVQKTQLQWMDLKAELDKAQRIWEAKVRKKDSFQDWSIGKGLLVHFPLDGELVETTGNVQRVWKDQVAGIDEGKQEKDVEFQKFALKPPFLGGARDNALEFVSGMKGKAALFDGRFVNAGAVASFNYMDPFTLSAWFYPRSCDGAILSSVQDKFRGRGYGLYLRESKLRFNFTYRWSDLGMRLETAHSLALNRWHHVALSYDGNRKASGVRLYLNGVLQEPVVLFDYLLWPMGSSRDFRLGAGEGSEDRFDGFIDEVRVYNRALSDNELKVVGLLDSVSEISARVLSDRSPAQKDKLRFCFLDGPAPEHIRLALTDVEEAQRERQEYFRAIPTVMVMKERKERRKTYVLDRGAYDAPGKVVSPDVPTILPPLPNGASRNRLALARWLVDPSNPLTARVSVNRFWQMLFGAGLVLTPEDFGSQGMRPTHPQLLDWLAADFVDSGWDVQELLKTIVTSATYRQTSRLTPRLLEKDPDNRLLARGARFRLSPQVIRDQALAISGLLVEKLGGPSVKPYQPPGLWRELTFNKKGYEVGQGQDLYRRSLYTFWRRTIAPPAMVTFDASNRETCVVRIGRTNTPLQALNLMNDETYLEASRRLAERMLKEGGKSSRARLRYGFQMATARLPLSTEETILLEVLGQFKHDFQAREEDAFHYLAKGASAWDETLDPGELSAYSCVASVILNLDETITKE